MLAKKFAIESMLWVKRLMIITGIYFYTVHGLAMALSSKSRLGLFNIGDSSYSFINDRFIEDEIKTRVNSYLEAKNK